MRRLTLTGSNTGLDAAKRKRGVFPELSSVFKASHVKVMLWWMARKAVQLASSSDVALRRSRFLMCGSCTLKLVCFQAARDHS